MFRLNFIHLQAYTIFSLSDALPTLGSHNVYNCGTLWDPKVGKAFGNENIV